MNKTIRNILRFTAFLTAGLVLLYFAFRGIDFSEMITHFKNAKYKWIALSLIFAIISHISRARRWTLLIEPIHGRKPGLWITINAVLFGYFANYAFPRIGEVTRCVALGKKEKIPVDSLIGTVIIERAIDLITMFIILFILLIARFETFGEFFSNYIFIPISDRFNNIFESQASFFIILSAVAGLFLLTFLLLRKRIYKTNIFQKIISLIKGLRSGLLSVLKMKKRREFLFHTVFIWFNYAMMSWVVVFALPDITGHLNFIDGIFLLVAGSLGMAVPVQAGIGAFHGIVSRGLHFVYGLEISEGLVFATLQHESQTILILVLGSISMLFLFSKRSKQKKSDLENQ